MNQQSREFRSQDDIHIADTIDASDRELLQRINTDRRAFKELMRRYRAEMIGASERIVRNPQDAEELVDDVFLRVCSHPKDVLNAGAGVRAALKSMVFSLSVDLLRKNQFLGKRISLQDVRPNQDAFRQFRKNQEPLEQVPDQKKLLLKFFQELNEEELQILEYLLHGEKISEIADTLECSIDAAWGRVRRVRQKMQKKYQELFSDIDL